MVPPTNSRNWKIRRRFMFVISGFCMAIISYIIIGKINTEPAETAVTMGFATLISIVGSYVFGAIWDDNNINTPKTNKQPTAGDRDEY